MKWYDYVNHFCQWILDGIRIYLNTIPTWIFCEDTPISYPVVFGRDNAYYLDHDYRGDYDPSGAIFADMNNTDGFADANVILYGHHIADGSMFGTLRKWMEQSYYEKHPVMWLMTPERDYRIELFAGYVTSSDSETYTVFHRPGPELEAYLACAQKWSEFDLGVSLDPEGHYVVLSTCDYSFEEARTVLHGMLVPVDSAGGLPLPQ